MKKSLFVSVFTLFTFSSIAQSVTLNPNNLQIPSVSALPACAAADYGKIVFLTSTNRANVCSGSGWVEVAAGGGGGSLTLPFTSTGSFSTNGIQVINSGGGVNSSALQGTTFSTSNDAFGVWGAASATSPTGNNAGVRGVNSSTNPVGYGVYGSHAGSGAGIYGQTATGFGVSGAATGIGTGVYGTSLQAGGTGVFGSVSASSGTGVLGRASQANAFGGFFENSSATGVALLTIGKLRFQGNGAAANRVLVSADASGNANWEVLTRTEILKLGPAAFQSHISTNESTIGSQGISMTTATGSFHANVSVPNGATITAVKVFYIDNDGVSPATGLGLTSWALQKLIHSGSNSYVPIIGISIPNIPASTSIQNVANTLTTPEVINNATTFYRMVVTMPASLNLILVGAEISYTYEVTN